jgi:PAS domain S-box-containing protein
MQLSHVEYETLVEQAPILIWRAGTDKLCNYFNLRWLEFTGRTLAQEVGNGWAEGVHAEDFQRCLDTYVANFDRRRVFEMVYRLRRYDGAWRWIFDRGVPFFDAGGAFQGYIGSCTDITEKVEAEEALRASKEEQIHRLLHLLPVCAWCGKIRSDDGYWLELDRYLASQQLGRVTHGMCQPCADKVLEEERADRVA